MILIEAPSYDHINAGLDILGISPPACKTRMDPADFRSSPLSYTYVGIKTNPQLLTLEGESIVILTKLKVRNIQGVNICSLELFSKDTLVDRSYARNMVNIDGS